MLKETRILDMFSNDFESVCPNIVTVNIGHKHTLLLPFQLL